MTTWRYIYAIITALTVAGTAQAAQNYVNNGSFESSAATLVNGSYCYLNVAGHECGSVSGWHGNFPLIQSGSGPWGMPNSPYGTVLVGLQNQSYAEQTLNLPAAGTYSLSWADAGRSHTGGTQTYRVLFNGIPLDTKNVALGAAWQNHTVTFTANGAGVLRFQGLNGNGDSAAFIDNIVVAPSVPEPGFYSMLLIGIGLLAFSYQPKAEKFSA